MTPRRVFVALVGVIALMVMLYGAIAREDIDWDLTAEGSASLSDETKRVVRAVDDRIQITSFFPPDSAGRVEAATLLAQYRRANRRITFRVLDPATVPGEAQRLGVEEFGAAAVEQLGEEDKVEIAQYTIEIDVTSAIARLVRGVDATVCFLEGHGERSIDASTPDGLADAASLLRENGYRVRSVDLLTTRSVTRGCAAVVSAAPKARSSGGTVRALSQYLTAGGKLVALADPDARADLTAVTKPFGITFVRGVVLEGDVDSHLPGDVTAPIVRRYAGGSPVTRGLGPTFFPRTMGVTGKSTGDPGLTVTELASTSEAAYLDREDVSEFDPNVDVGGPVALGASADDSEVLDAQSARPRIRRTRVLAWGDVDFATNAYLEDGSNATLWVQGIDWLTQPEDLVTAVPQFPKVRELGFTEARSRYMLFLMAGVIPGLFLIAGALVWVLRRGR